MRLTQLRSKFRRKYFARFYFRCFSFVLMVLLYIFVPGQFEVMEGFVFFRKFTVLHLMWALWMTDMVLQLIPCRSYWPLGSQKFLKACFEPIREHISLTGLTKYIRKCTRDTLVIGSIWLALTVSIGFFYFQGFIRRGVLLLISVAFYVCDVICVLFWCPFRALLMKNRCCTTCRIFNWDHMMMFSPLLFVPSFFNWSLCGMSIVVLLVWELTFAIHPERFWEGSNAALKCANCTDILCGHLLCPMKSPHIAQHYEEM